MRHALLCLALLPPWTWDPVMANCKGGPESAPVYVVTQVLEEPAGYRRDCAIDEAGEEVCMDNIIYWPPVLVRVDVTSETALPDEFVAVPPLGGVTFLDVEAIDEAGNVSGGICE